MSERSALPLVQSMHGAMRFRIGRFLNGAFAVAAVSEEGEPIDTCALNLVEAADQLEPLQFFVRTDRGDHSSAALLLSCQPLVFHATGQSLRYGSFDGVAQVFDVVPAFRDAVLADLQRYDVRHGIASNPPSDDDDSAVPRP